MDEPHHLTAQLFPHTRQPGTDDLHFLFEIGVCLFARKAKHWLLNADGKMLQDYSAIRTYLRKSAADVLLLFFSLLVLIWFLSVLCCIVTRI